MKIKKKNNKNSNKLFSFLKSLSFFIIILQIIVITILFSYYFNSGLSQKISFERVKNKIFKVIGFDYQDLKTLPEIYSGIITSYFNNDLPEIDVSLSQESLIDLDIQRKKRLQNLEYEEWKYVNGNLNFNNQKYKIKVRPRGARKLHYIDFNKMSFRIDMRGGRYFQGIEEFNLHKPLLRNYIHEWIFHKMLNENGIFTPNYYFVNLKINGSPRGIYALEETFSKELIERNNNRFGPVFEFDSKVGVNKDISKALLVYNEKFWLREENKKFYSNALYVLENFLKNDDIFHNYVDIEKWAKFFAISDLTRAYHATVKHSVRFFFNPVTAKIEPIPFDGHIGTGDFISFLLLDFTKSETRGCYWICYEKPFYERFFKNLDGTLRNDFIQKYLETLKKVSDEKYLISFFENHKSYIKKMNNLFYREGSKKDLIFYEGISRYFFNKSYYFDRALEIKNRINSENLKNSIKIKNLAELKNLKFLNRKNGIPVYLESLDCGETIKIQKYFYLDEIIKTNIPSNFFCKNGKFLINNKIKNIPIDNSEEFSIKKKKELNNFITVQENIMIQGDYQFKENTIFNKNSKFVVTKNSNIKLNNNIIIFDGSKFDFQGSKNEKINIVGPGSLVFKDTEGKITGTILKNLTQTNIFGHILYSGINILNSNILLDEVIIKDIEIEDGINFVHSTAIIGKLIFSNIKFDALDADFSTIKFDQINCQNIGNDCLDTSGSKVSGKKISAYKIGDKALSFGEASNINIEKVNINNSFLALATKDGSNVTIKNFNIEDNKFDIALYKKKEFYTKRTRLKINKINIPKDLSSIKILKNQESLLNLENFKQKNARIINSKEILNIISQ